MSYSEAEKAARRRQKYLRSVGRPSRVTGERFLRAQSKLRSYLARGMTASRISEQTGIGMSTLHYIPKNSGILAKHYEAIMRMEFQQPEGCTLIDATGTRRRLGAMWRDGFPLPFIAERLGRTHRTYLQRVVRGGLPRSVRPHTVTAELAADIRDLYDKLEASKPEDFGIEPGAVSRSNTWAAKKGIAPRHCWDPDTIDDPEAIPEWTGACGTAEGLRIHQREGIPACPACSKVNLGPAHGTFSLNPARLQEARERAGLSLVEVGQRVGVHNSTVYYWETGRSAPRSRNIIDRYLAVLDLNPEDAV